MIQSADDGSEPAEPLKSSLHTRLQPPGVGGTAAPAAVSAMTGRRAAPMAASRRRIRGRPLGTGSGDMIFLISLVGADHTLSARTGAGPETPGRRRRCQLNGMVTTERLPTPSEVGLVPIALQISTFTRPLTRLPSVPEEDARPAAWVECSQPATGSVAKYL